MNSRLLAAQALLALVAAPMLVGCQVQQTPPAESQSEPAASSPEDLEAKKAELQRQLAEIEQQERQLAESEKPAHAAPAPAAAPSPAPPPAPSPRPTAAPAEPTPAAPRPKPAPEPAPKPVPPPPPPPEVVTIAVPPGTEFELQVTTPLSSETSQPGDGFSAQVVDDVIVDGETVIPAGSVVEGFVKDVTSTSKKIGGTAKLELDFDRLVLPNGETAAVQMAFVAAGKSQSGKDAATIGGAAAGGALLGRLLKKKHKSKGTLIGAILGGAIGAAVAANNPGDPVEIPEGTVLPVRLENTLTVKLVDGRPTFSGTAP